MITIYYDRTLTLGDMAAELAAENKLNEQAAAEKLKILGVVEERSPGRLQLRLKPELRTPESMQMIEHMIEQDPLIQDVTVNQQTGTIVIEFTEERGGQRGGQVGAGRGRAIAATLFELPEGEEGGGGYGKLDQQLANVLYKMDRVVYKKTGLGSAGKSWRAALPGWASPKSSSTASHWRCCPVRCSCGSPGMSTTE